MPVSVGNCTGDHGTRKYVNTGDANVMAEMSFGPCMLEEDNKQERDSKGQNHPEERRRLDVDTRGVGESSSVVENQQVHH